MSNRFLSIVLVTLTLFETSNALGGSSASGQFELTGGIDQQNEHTAVNIRRVGIEALYGWDSSTDLSVGLDFLSEELLEFAFVTHRWDDFGLRLGKDLLLNGGYEARERNRAWLFPTFIERYHALFLKHEPAATVTFEKGMIISLQAVNDLSNSLERPGYFSNQTQPALLTELVYPAERAEFLVQWGLFDLLRSQSGSLGFKYAGVATEFALTLSGIRRAVKYQHVIKYYDIAEGTLKLMVNLSNQIKVGMKLGALEVQQPDYPERSLSNREDNRTSEFDDNGRTAQLILEKVLTSETRSFVAYGLEKGRGSLSANETRALSIGISFVARTH